PERARHPHRGRRNAGPCSSPGPIPGERVLVGDAEDDQGEVLTLDEWTARPRISIRLAGRLRGLFSERVADRHGPTVHPDAGTTPRTPHLPRRAQGTPPQTRDRVRREGPPRLKPPGIPGTNRGLHARTDQREPPSRPAGTRAASPGFQSWERAMGSSPRPLGQAPAI